MNLVTLLVAYNLVRSLDFWNDGLEHVNGLIHRKLSVKLSKATNIKHSVLSINMTLRTICWNSESCTSKKECKSKFARWL